MSIDLKELKNTGGNLTKVCTECGTVIHKYSHNICLDCEEENQNKGNKPLAPYPTNALPGTERRILVMSWRVYKGYSLWHPRDLRGDYFNLKDWLTPDPKQEEFEQRILIEIRQVLKDLEVKRKIEFEEKKATIQSRQKLKNIGV